MRYLQCGILVLSCLAVVLQGSSSFGRLTYENEGKARRVMDSVNKRLRGSGVGDGAALIIYNSAQEEVLKKVKIFENERAIREAVLRNVDKEICAVRLRSFSESLWLEGEKPSEDEREFAVNLMEHILLEVENPGLINNASILIREALAKRIGEELITQKVFRYIQEETADMHERSALLRRNDEAIEPSKEVIRRYLEWVRDERMGVAALDGAVAKIEEVVQQERSFWSIFKRAFS